MVNTAPVRGAARLTLDYLPITPFWVILKLLPAAVTVALRLEVDQFEETLYRTVPLPVPDFPVVIVTQPASLVAVQAQVEPAVTLMLPDPPFQFAELDAGEIE